MARRDCVIDLIQRCTAAHARGADFPKVWQEILRASRLVVGVPVQRLEGTHAFLAVRLITGERIVCDANGYTLG